MAGAVFGEFEEEGFGVFGPVAFAEVVEEEDVHGGEMREPGGGVVFAGFVLGAEVEAGGGVSGDAAVVEEFAAEQAPDAAGLGFAGGAGAEDQALAAVFPLQDHGEFWVGEFELHDFGATAALGGEAVDFGAEFGPFFFAAFGEFGARRGGDGAATFVGEEFAVFVAWIAEGRDERAAHHREDDGLDGPLFAAVAACCGGVHFARRGGKAGVRAEAIFRDGDFGFHNAPLRRAAIPGSVQREEFGFDLDNAGAEFGIDLAPVFDLFAGVVDGAVDAVVSARDGFGGVLRAEGAAESDAGHARDGDVLVPIVAEEVGGLQVPDFHDSFLDSVDFGRRSLGRRLRADRQRWRERGVWREKRRGIVGVRGGAFIFGTRGESARCALFERNVVAAGSFPEGKAVADDWDQHRFKVSGSRFKGLGTECVF